MIHTLINFKTQLRLIYIDYNLFKFTDIKLKKIYNVK